ncbi:transcriptional regulator [Yersinia enterocolitica]|uniref:winged helix-turn-helix domain-containing protein n=1 Tax=Yersinia enterocolitica TaxID=630 RepID=UPI0027E77D22|nr:transcriptional regulator [Yersinia enterocolitica]EKN3570119.1 transcriptional regulator [Yersinia enterocolitica]EKN4742673.1 transcriptional regulator [Yersinia enterocolitica]EKN4838528.1 transcriptional regulator [Yersinia enterocolitica]EKN5088320.1 transcriptional regulator [Yersinia enterocolitica]
MKKHQYIVNRWSIDLTSGFISHQESGEQKRLGEYQLKLLNVLLQHPGQILSRDELTNLVWKRRVIGNNSLPNAVHTLRVALGDDKKQQRIIQTIPKIGYLLDATYCEIIEEDEVTPVSDTDIADQQSTVDSDLLASDEQTLLVTAAENNETPQETAHSATDLSSHQPLSDDGAAPENNTTTLLPALPVLTVHSPQQHGITKKNKWLFGLLAVAAIGCGIALYFAFKGPSGPSYRATEQEQGTYSNIKMFQIDDSRFDKQNADNLYTRLKDTLYKVDKDLKTKDAYLTIYYHISLRRLDYTISVENQCDKKQLNMTIYHWRQDDNLLNNVIYDETERKINEMPAC